MAGGGIEIRINRLNDCNSGQRCIEGMTGKDLPIMTVYLTCYKLSVTSHFSNDLGLDSLDTVEVVMAIEEVRFYIQRGRFLRSDFFLGI